MTGQCDIHVLTRDLCRELATGNVSLQLYLISLHLHLTCANSCVRGGWRTINILCRSFSSANNRTRKGWIGCRYGSGTGGLRNLRAYFVGREMHLGGSLAGSSRCLQSLNLLIK